MSDDPISNARHSLAHLLGAAVISLYPDALLAIGPAIDNGFYYDIDTTAKISDADLPRIEEKMREILKTWNTFNGKEVTPEEAKKMFAHNPYKLEIIAELEESHEPITIYTSGTFSDLCRGGHVATMSDVDPDSFSLDRLAGAYWRGSEKNKMLTRIYGLSFSTKGELDEYKSNRQEAEKRDHRKLGRELDLFFIDDMIGKGLILWLPNGTIIRNEIEKLAIEMETQDEYVRVSTPHIAKEELYITSGHLPYYKDSMYPGMVMDDGTYYLRGMNCPHHHRIYLYKPRSYRDLPLRLAEYGTVYRNELSGTLTGLLRVRGLSMNDAHIYCRKDQIKDEFKKVMELTMNYFKLFGLSNYWFRLSKWSPEHTEKYINQPENWEYSQNILREVLVEMKVPFKEVDDEAAFYGPKVDVQFKSLIGREETMSTIQLDFLAKERFGLSYIGNDGKENKEVFVIHRAPLSTHERFMAFLIEQFAGAFPTWLSPVQVSILPISEKQKAYAESIEKALKDHTIRVSLDDSNETLGKRIRQAKQMKVPYVLIIGDKEMGSNTVTIEKRDGTKIENISVDDFTVKLTKEINDRSLSLLS